MDRSTSTPAGQAAQAAQLAQLAGLRRLLLAVLALVLAAAGACLYVASRLDRHRDEVARLGVILQKQTTGQLMAQSLELQKRMDRLNGHAAGLDGKVEKALKELDDRIKRAQSDFETQTRAAEDQFVARMKSELPG